MKLVVNLKLTPTPAQAKSLKQTLETANQACNYLSQRGWDAKILRQYDLHKLAYHDTKQKFELAADMVIRCIAKVADAYKAGRATRRTFRPHAAQPYNHHILSFKKGDLASIWTVAGRLPIPFVMGATQRTLFAHRQGEIDLLYIDRVFYLACVCDIDDPELIKISMKGFD
jgi:predicted transposase